MACRRLKKEPTEDNELVEKLRILCLCTVAEELTEERETPEKSFAYMGRDFEMYRRCGSRSGRRRNRQTIQMDTRPKESTILRQRK